MLEPVTTCELCGATGAPEILIKNGWRLVRWSCGLVYVIDAHGERDSLVVLARVL